MAVTVRFLFAYGMILLRRERVVKLPCCFLSTEGISQEEIDQLRLFLSRRAFMTASSVGMDQVTLNPPLTRLFHTTHSKWLKRARR
jgi:hypothetical protein